MTRLLLHQRLLRTWKGRGRKCLPQSPLLMDKNWTRLCWTILSTSIRPLRALQIIPLNRPSRKLKMYLKVCAEPRLKVKPRTV
ncbi:wsv152 [White spot syndrome virus]|uniref:Wsv152 n=3 Tax=White spot syndrome virus TaxID=342409 RepID=Q8VB45_WSSVS|nr:wsv152 [Shrimp white spot syndrome virus]AFX59530.1 wsv152 [White spot syndrome virus]AAL33156.1 wsv152 [Shrimp white spot syndrome virus]AAL89076.1 WSSV208 [Shrimp white spot syndrome virus]AWQ60334.1 wsv152 [Shrimp white spot syndrome virus]AWQ60748.1 wsv152 [Shrimp white spot syndrome virus]